MMSRNYEAEQKQLETEAISLRQEIEVQERQYENIERFIQTAEKYVDIEELDAYTLRELVQAIYVEAPINPAVNVGRIYTSTMTESDLFRWMN